MCVNTLQGCLAGWGLCNTQSQSKSKHCKQRERSNISFIRDKCQRYIFKHPLTHSHTHSEQPTRTRTSFALLYSALFQVSNLTKWRPFKTEKLQFWACALFPDFSISLFWDTIAVAFSKKLQRNTIVCYFAINCSNIIPLIMMCDCFQ